MVRDDIQTDVAVIGAGPAGLAAAEMASKAGARTTVFDWTPSPGRKFLMAGKSGLNLTNLEPFDQFQARFGAASGPLTPILAAYPPQAVIEWCEALGQPTFVGGGGRAFPKKMKASPLLRAWLSRLAAQRVMLHRRWRWTGWNDNKALTFYTPDGPHSVEAKATVLATGGASWPRLGSDAAWTELFSPSTLAPLAPSNVGWEIEWSPWFRDTFTGVPVKATSLRIGDAVSRGEWVITGDGVEGGAIYTLGAALRAA
ncbi:MAG: TIGR03862 family flavoprotein, partial [Rhodobacteraceae bacterium]|nr:TIGR03862 family flavoprotein [Paracoccaceae bacterium]